MQKSEVPAKARSAAAPTDCPPRASHVYTPGVRAKLKRILGVLLGTAVLGYLGICVYVYAAQKRFIFHPTSGAGAIDRLRQGPGEAFDLEAPGAALRGVFVPAEVEGPAPALLYFGGNAEPVARRVPSFGWLRGAGVHLAVLPYRGYDGSSGSPDSDHIHADALAAYDKLAADLRVDPEKIYTMGFSLGSGVANYVSSERKVAGLLLVAPYRRLGEIAETIFPWLPVGLLIQHEFYNLAYAAENATPVIVAHGDADTMIPPQHGRDVVAAWRGPARLVLLPGQGHDGASAHPKTQAALRELLAGAGTK